MKTIRYFLICVLTTVCAISYAQNTKVLSNRTLDGWERALYFYNDQNLIDSMYIDITGSDPYEAYRTFEYNDKGQIIRENSYQNISGEFIHVFYIDYQYTEDGLIKSRLNYNRGGDIECTLSAKMEWEYKDGKVDKVVTYFPGWDNPEEFELFAEDRYFYENDVLKQIETWIIPFHFPQLSKSAVVEYTFNSAGKILQEYARNYNTETGSVVSVAKNEYKYDKDGDMIEYANYLESTGDPVLKFIYHHNKDIKNENVVYPFNFEDKSASYMIAMQNSTHIVEKEEWWQVPLEGGALFHGGDYIWTYSDTGETSIQSMPFSQGVNFFINEDNLYLQGLEQGKPVYMYDANGSLVKQISYSNNGISLSNLQHGVYMLRAEKQVFRFVK